MEGVGGWSYPGCSHEDVLLSVQVGGSMCVYRPAIAAISIKHRVTMPQSPLYLDIYVSTRSSSRQASDKERCGQGRRASCPVASVPITMQTIAQHTTTTAAITTLIRHKFLFTWLTLWRPATTSPLSHTYLHIYHLRTSACTLPAPCRGSN